MSGRKQHYLPATFLAGFAEVVRAPRRESVLWVGRREAPSAFTKKAEGVAFLPDLYTVTNAVLVSREAWSSNQVDAIWTPVEGGLAPAIDAIASAQVERVDARQWLLLVEFVAQVFVRGPEFGHRFTERFPPELLAGITVPVGTPSHINGARLLELHRLRNIVYRAEWTVLHAASGRFVTNDMGRCPIARDSTEQVGYLIPLRFDAALALTFRVGHEPMSLRPLPNDTWSIGPIRREPISESDVRHLNRYLTASARHEIYGATEHEVQLLHSEMASTSPPEAFFEPTNLPAPPKEGWSQDHTALATVIATPPSTYLARSSDDAGRQGGGSPT